MYKTLIKTPNLIRTFSSLPNLKSCITSLQLCATHTNIHQGKKLHSYMIINGFLTSPQTITSLINMYSKCNNISDAFMVFNSSFSTSEPNVFTYNTIIAGFIYNEMPKLALKVFDKMRVAAVMMDRFTFPCVVKAYSGCRDVVGLRGIHGLVFKFGLDHDLFVGSAVVHGYLRFELLGDAHQVFDEMPERDVVLWNAMINGYAQIGEFPNALECLRKLRVDGNVPSRFTVTGILSVITVKGDVYNGKAVHGFVIKMGYFSGVAVCNALIDMYGKCKCFLDAFGIFELLAIKDIYSWNSIIGVHQQSGDHEGTLKLFDLMLRDKVFSPDLVTVTTVLPACSHLAALRHGKEIHAYMITKGLGKDDGEDRADDTYVNNAIMDMYGKCGCMREARLVFDNMSTKDPASWNIMIMGYAMHGFGNEALNLFHKMCEKGLTPDEVTFVGVLSACNHAGLVKEGQEFLSQMKSKYNITPAVEHYTCVIDMFGRAGLLNQAYGLLSEMPIDANSVVWRAFLAACRLHGDANLAKIAARKVIDLEPEHCGSYVLMSNVYGTLGRYEEVSDVRLNMRQQNVKKTPGCSWIEFGDGVHVFGTGDWAHPDEDSIYSELNSLYMSMGLCHMT
ncbi:putative tetratricopeptide-like helical domain superfamily [Helianthus debilis subsp. tardiflorus]